MQNKIFIGLAIFIGILLFAFSYYWTGTSDIRFVKKTCDDQVLQMPYTHSGLTDAIKKIEIIELEIDTLKINIDEFTEEEANEIFPLKWKERKLDKADSIKSPDRISELTEALDLLFDSLDLRVKYNIETPDPVDGESRLSFTQRKIRYFEKLKEQTIQEFDVLQKRLYTNCLEDTLHYVRSKS